jgi:hypothetical protein
MSEPDASVTTCHECRGKGFALVWCIPLWLISYRPQLSKATCPGCDGSGVDRGRTVALLRIGLEPKEPQ